MSAETSATDYRWLKIAHQDLDFWGIAGPLPWPAEEQRKIEPRGSFPFETLLEGIKRLRAAGRQWKPEWEAIEKFLLAGNDLGDAIERGDFETTLGILGELELLRPGTAYCPSNRAFVFKSQGKLEAALAEAVKATERAPRVENQWMLRGHLHEDLGQEKDAVFCYRKALGLLPNHQNALEGLARLGAMVKVTMRHPDGNHAVRFATPQKFRQEIADDVVKMPPDDSQLRSLLRQFRELRNAECALLVLDRMLEGEPEDALLLRTWRADSLRLLSRREQALRELEAILSEAPLDAEALYVKAWCYFDAKENGSGWHFIEQTLCSDPNHLRAIQDLFRHGSRVEDPTFAEEVADWAKEQHSWRGYWLASAQCSTLHANASALRYAQAAYELAPQERDALFLYSIAPELGREVANLEIMPRTMNRRKGAAMGARQRDLAGKFLAAGGLTRAQYERIVE